MINALFNSPAYQGAKAMMDMTAARHQAIASNISNLETPGYKRIDIAPAFEAELKSAMDSGDMSRAQSMRPSLAVDQTAVTTNRDGNTVQLENELLAMTKNTLSHQLETRLVSGTLNKIRMAATGRAR
jgi:flagellar basal-body rod protein FlgB